MTASTTPRQGGGASRARTESSAAPRAPGRLVGRLRKYNDVVDLVVSAKSEVKAAKAKAPKKAKKALKKKIKRGRR